MAEKADMPSDTVSLPPNYAPSETYTESPPPAYKKSGMAAVRIARIVCFTLLAMTFVIGFFVVMHNWVENRNCNCDQTQHESQLIKHAALLAQVPNLPNSDLNNNKIEEDIEKEEDGIVPADVRPKEEIIPKEQMVPEENEKSDDANSVKALLEKARDVSLPKDLLLGNPKLAGRNVHCKMEKRQRKIAEGIMTQAIIVTCDDDEDDDENNESSLDGRMQGPIPVRPPLSLLNSIMKVLSSRPRSNQNDINVEQRPILFPARSMNGQLPVPIMHPINGRLPFPFPGPMSPHVNFVPLRKIEIRRPFPEIEENESRFPIMAQGSLPMMPEGRQFSMDGIFPPRHIIQRPQENNIHVQRIPFPLPAGPLPIRMIRLSPRRNEIFEDNQSQSREDDENESPLPIPFHPLMKLLPARRRIIRFRPKPTLGPMQDESIPFPLPRGALPLRHPSDESIIPHPMPEASGRALPSPVALPGVRVVRLPFRPQPQPFPEANIITHMEVRQPSEDINNSQEPKNSLLSDIVPENKGFNPDNLEFGPPKTHSVIENSPRQIFGDEDIENEPFPPEHFHQEPITQTQSQPRFVAPPPPRFAREGRTSFLAQLNPDAEVIPTPQEEIGSGNQEPTLHQIVLN